MFAIERPGDGPAVVCLHGFCQSSAYWAPTLDRVASLGRHGLAVDLPGFGASAAEPGPYTMEALADAVAALLEARGLERMVLVGGSMGGVVAQHLALRHPQRVGRLLLVATGAMTADPPAALAKADHLAKAPWVEATVAPIVDAFFHRAMPEEEIAAFRQVALSARQPAAVEAAISNARSSILDRLPAIAVPTLIVQGRHDRARTPEHGAAMGGLIPDARLAVIEDAGHTPQLEQPAAFHDVVLPFIAGGT